MVDRPTSSDATAIEQHLGMVVVAWMSLDLRPRLILDDNAHIVWNNEAAQRLIGKRIGLVDRDGLLSLHDRAATSELESFLRQLGASASTLTIALERPAGHLLLRGMRVSTAESRYHCIEITVDHPDFRPVYSDFSDVFRLTRSERNVVDALLDGSSPTEIARNHGISVVTVRSHTKKVYAKVGVNSREQLFSRLRPFQLA